MRCRRTIGIALLSGCFAVPTLHASPILNGAYTDLNLFQISASSLNLQGQYSAATFRSDSDALMLATYNFASPNQTVYALNLTRAGGHINGFSSISQANTVVANLGVYGRSVESLAFAPNGSLLFTDGPTFPDMLLGQKSSTNEFYSALTNTDTDGAAGYVPGGLPGAGKLKLASSFTGQWFNITLTNPSGGIYQVALSGPNATTATTPSSFVYVAQGFSSGLSGNAVLVADSQGPEVNIYNIDGNGDPSTLVGQLLNGAQIVGMAKDPLTNDILLVTSSNELYVIRNSQSAATPEPAAGLLVLTGIAAVTIRWRKSRRRYSV
jgi:hypothetical protein